MAERTQAPWPPPRRSATTLRVRHDGPPSMTVMFSFSDTVFSDDFHLGLKFDAAFGLGPGLDDFDQLQNIAGAGIAFIDDKISMHRRDTWPRPGARLSIPVPQSACRPTRIGDGFLKMQPALGSFGCEVPAPLIESAGALRYGLLRVGPAPKSRRPARCLPGKTGRTGIRPGLLPMLRLMNLPGVSMNEHCVMTSKIALPMAPGVHTQRAADAAGNAFEKFQSGQINSRALAETALSRAPAPQCNRGAIRLDRRDARMRQDKSPRRALRRRAPEDWNRGPES